MAQPTIDIISPAAGVCVGNGDEVFPGFPGGNALPDPIDVPLVLEIGSMSGDPVELSFEVDGVVVFDDVFDPDQANTPEQTDSIVLPGFGVEDAQDFELTVRATADGQERNDVVTFRLDRAPPQMVIDLDDLDLLDGCHEDPPNLPFETEDDQDPNPQRVDTNAVDGCIVTQTFTLTDDCGNAQAVNVAYQQAPDPGSVSVEVTGYRCGLEECVIDGEGAQTFDAGDRIGRGTVVYEIDQPNGCVDSIDANIVQDGGEPQVIVPGQAYESAGAYVATVTVGACGQELDTDELGFTVLERPEADPGGPYGGPDAPIVQGELVAIDGSGSSAAAELGGIVEVAWDLNNDGFYDEEEGTELETTFDSSVGDGVHRIWLRVRSGNGGVAFADTTVTVDDIDPNCALAAVEGEFVEGDAVTFDASASTVGHETDPLSHYAWDFGDGGNGQVAAGLVRPSHIFEDSGEFTVTVQVHDIDSFCEAETVVVVTDCNPIVENIGAFAADRLLEGEPVRFTAGTTHACNAFDGIDSYRWTFEPGLQPVEGAGLREPEYTYDEQGTKNVCLEVIDEDGSAEECFDIEVADLDPTPEFAAPVIVGEGEEACFDATNTVAGGAADPLDHFVWDFGDNSPDVVVDDPAQRVVCHVFEGSGEFTVTLAVHDEDSQADFERVVQVTDVTPTARGRAVLDGEQRNVDEGQIVRFDASDSEPGAASDPIVLYTWQFGDGEDAESDSPDAQHAYGDDGTYAVRLTVTDSDGSEQSDTFTVEVRNRAPRIELELVNGQADAEGNPQIEIGTDAEFRITVDDVEADLPPGRVVWDFGDGTGTGDDVNDAPRLMARHRYGELGQVRVAVEVDDYDGNCVAIEPVAANRCDGANPPEECACSDHHGDGDECLRQARGEGDDAIRVCRIVGSNDTAELVFDVTPAAPRILPPLVPERCEGELVEFDVRVESAVRGQEGGVDVYDGPVVLGYPRKPPEMVCSSDPDAPDRAEFQMVRCSWRPTFFDSGDHVMRITAVGPFSEVSRSMDVQFSVRECGQPLLAGIGGSGTRGLLRLFAYGRRAGNVSFDPTAEVVVGLGASGLAVGPDGRYIYVASPGSGGVAVVNAINRPRVLRTIPTGSNPSAVVLGAVDGTPWVWAINSGDDTLSVIDPDTLKVEHTLSLAPVRGAYDLAWLGEVYDGEGCEGPGDGCVRTGDARLVVSSRRGGQVALFDPARALEGEAEAIAIRRFPGPIVRVAAEGRSGVIGAAEGKSRVVHAFDAADLEDGADALETTAQAVHFIPRDLFVRDGVVHALTDSALTRVTPGEALEPLCSDVSGAAVAPLPDSMLPDGDFVAWQNGRVENFVRDDGGAACGAARAIGAPAPRLRRMTTFVGME